MTRSAENVYIDQADIHRLEALIRDLPASGHVALHLRNGTVCEGIVSERPNIQMFQDANATEGANAIVRLQRPHTADAFAPGSADQESRWIWLDDVLRVEHLDSTRMHEGS